MSISAEEFYYLMLAEGDEYYIGQYFVTIIFNGHSIVSTIEVDGKEFTVELTTVHNIRYYRWLTEKPCSVTITKIKLAKR